MDETITQQYANVARLYAALLDRAPEASGMRYWTSLAANGISWEAIVESMLSTPAVRFAYPPELTPSAFLSILYEKLFDRLPDAAGAAFWVDALEKQGPYTINSFAWLTLQIAESASQPVATRPCGHE